MNEKLTTTDQLRQTAQRAQALSATIAAAVAEAIEETATSKQDKLTGTAGQVVGFDESGNAAARFIPAEMVSHYAKVLVGNGDNDKIAFVSSYTNYPNETARNMIRFMEAKIIGHSIGVDPDTGNQLYFGNIRVGANVKPDAVKETTWDFIKNGLKFRITFSNAENKRLVLNEAYSISAGRMMSFQGVLASGRPDVDAQDSGQFLRGVYGDAAVSNDVEDETDKAIVVTFNPVNVIRGDLGYTYWIEWQTPICWTYE